jgi:hypothetical protein
MERIMAKSLSQQLRDIFSMKNMSSQFFAMPGADDRQLTKAEIWIDDILEIQTQFPDFLARSKSSNLQFKVTGIYADMITAACRSFDEQQQLFLDRVHDTPVGCTCELSKGEMPCVHGYQFTRYLLQQLRVHSNLTQRINNGNLDSNPPPYSHFVPDLLAKYKSLLNRTMRSVSSLPPPTTVQPLELTVTPPEKVGRIVWSVKYDGKDDFDVDPIYQTVKKRGGWNKGKRISIESLSEHSDILTPIDRRVCSKIDYHNYYQDILDPFEAAIELIGASNVLINNQPGSIEAGNLVATLENRPDHCALYIGNLTKTRTLFDEGYIELDEAANILQVCRISEAQYACASSIQAMPKVPHELREDVIALARQIQVHLTVNLPEEVAGPQVDDAARPLLLLMVDDQGSLSYGNRVRLSSGRVAKPGQGALVVPDTREGQPIQLVRNHQNEVGMWRQLNEQIGLPCVGDTEGRLTDFETVLQVLKSVRELEADEQKLEVLWDQKSQKPLRLLGSVTPASLRVGVQKSRDWLQLNGECDFGGDEKMELTTLLRSLRNLDASSIQGNYVKLGDHGWAKISEALRKQLNKLDDSVNEDRKKLVFDASSATVVQDLSKMQIQVDGTAAWTQCLERIERASRIVPELPGGLNAQLRDYQREGYCWMRRLAEWGVGGVLADDMGLGKTLQTLAVLLDRIDSGPALVIAPTSVGFNWVREAEKFTPALKAQLYRETDRADFLSNIGPGNIVVCSYGLALRDADKLAKIEWGTLVLDEAQAVKNARSKTATAISEIKADWKVALTGTRVNCGVFSTR